MKISPYADGSNALEIGVDSADNSYIKFSNKGIIAIVKDGVERTVGNITPDGKLDFIEIPTYLGNNLVTTGDLEELDLVIDLPEVDLDSFIEEELATHSVDVVTNTTTTVPIASLRATTKVMYQWVNPNTDIKGELTIHATEQGTFEIYDEMFILGGTIPNIMYDCYEDNGSIVLRITGNDVNPLTFTFKYRSNNFGSLLV